MGINNPGGTNTRVLLHSEILAVAGRFDVQNISQLYNSLEVFLFIRSSVSATGDNVYLHFNGDTIDADYRSIQQYIGSATTNTLYDLPLLTTCPAASVVADYFGIVEFIIQRYAANFFKIFRAFSAERRDATLLYGINSVMHWENSAAINRITIQPDGYPTDNFIAGSQLQIWGITA